MGIVHAIKVLEKVCSTEPDTMMVKEILLGYLDDIVQVEEVISVLQHDQIITLPPTMADERLFAKSKVYTNASDMLNDWAMTLRRVKASWESEPVLGVMDV